MLTSMSEIKPDAGIVLVLSIYIYGGGGHAKVVVDILHKQGASVLGFVDDSPTRQGQHIHGVPVFPSSLITDLEVRSFQWIVAIGDNRVRKLIVEKLSLQGGKFATAIHPSAQIALGVTIAPGTVVMANAVLNTDAQVGHHAIINTGATIDHDCVIADYAHIAPGCSLCGQVVVGSGALLGVGTKVKPAMEIGAWTTCGAGSTVVASLPPNVVAYGCPARVVHSPTHYKTDVASNFSVIAPHGRP
jgi:sugar O-acyltransferase (sialic acid O-acetyltransferase NeuD family)